MAKKRKISKRNHGAGSRRNQKDPHIDTSYKSIRNEILSFVFKHGEPLTIPEIYSGLTAIFESKKEVETHVSDLVQAKELMPTGKKRFRIDDKGTIFAGRLEKNQRGFGFVTALQPKEPAQFLVKDPFLSINRMGSANHGDRLLIRILQVRSDGRPEAELISIIERSSERLTGFFKNGTPPRVIPEDPRYPSHIFLVEKVPEEAREGDAVIVQILPQHATSGQLSGKIVEVLGSPENIDVQMRMVIENFDLPHQFSPESIKETESMELDIADLSQRTDLRDIPHVTIDGETAKDFDDAIAVSKRRGGYRLYVSIADVSHYVRPGSNLDKEAYIRGTSIYFPGRVIPMLPEKLSNNLCSLVPKEDRLTFSAILDFDRSGRRISKSFCKSIICSRHRFTYTTVKEIVVDNNSETRRNHKAFLTPLKWAGELAEILYTHRIERGSIGFNIPEPEITLEDDGNIKSIARAKRNWAHQIIEEFMLAANEAVAETFTEAGRECIYRIHEKPELEKVTEFASFAKTLGIELPPATIDPSWFAKLLTSVKDRPTEYVINNLLLRAMKQARYDSLNQGHFGLAATDYTHFTSPIRRYPDLLVHRYLEAFLHNKNSIPKKDAPTLKEQSIHLSARERTAINAERNMNERLKIFFMQKFIGTCFEAIISGVSDSLLYVELLDLFVSGSIEISRLKDDYYLFDEKRYRLIGEIRGKTYQLGDPIRVKLIDIDHLRKRMHFIPAADVE